MEKTIKHLTNQRERLDAVKTAINTLPKSRGTSLAFTSLEKGRMYIGEICRELGKEYPYEATKQATDAKGIQDAVDTAKTDTPAIQLVSNEVVNLNTIREVLEQELTELIKTIGSIKSPTGHREAFEMSCVCSEAWRGLKETRMWLGIRLGEIKDNSK
jgi:hypothetical protein